MNIDLERFKSQGFLHLRGVFEPRDMDVLEQAIIARLESQIADGSVIEPPSAPGLQLYRGELLNDPVLRNIVLDQRLTDTAHGLLGEQVCYFGDASIHYGTRSEPGYATRGLHRDCTAAMMAALQAHTHGGCALIRFGLYFQDHSSGGGSLCVIPGSHADPARQGPLTAVTTRPGDLVVWDHRILHVGHAPGIPGIRSSKRLALFASFGRPGPAVQDYIAWIGVDQGWMGHAVVRRRWEGTKISAECLAMLKARHITALAPIAGYGGLVPH